MLGYSLIGRVAANAKRGRGQVAALGLVGATMGIVATPAHAAGPTSPGTSWVVMNAATGQVIAAQHPYTLRYPASLTKLMTLDLTFAKLTAGQLNQSTRIPVSLAAADVQPVKLYLHAGQTISIKNAMLGMTTLSANDAASIYSPPHHAGRMMGSPAKAARSAPRADIPCNRPVAMTLAAAA